jgi:hypothetical protein
VELAAAQYLGPVHELWEASVVDTVVHTHPDMGVGLCAKAKVSVPLL